MSLCLIYWIAREVAVRERIANGAAPGTDLPVRFTIEWIFIVHQIAGGRPVRAARPANRGD